MDLTATQKVPFRNIGVQLSSNRNNSEEHLVTNQSQNETFLLKNSIKAKTYFFTGSAERVMAWNRVFKQRCFFEVIATPISYQQSEENSQNIILLKDKKGPILQVINYFEHEMLEEEFILGQMLRCVGYMTGINTMVAVSMRRATPEEIASLKRFCYIGDFTISGLMNAEENR